MMNALVAIKKTGPNKFDILQMVELAEECGFSGSWTISRLETQGTNNLAMLETVCKALGIEVWELLRDALAGE